MDGLKKFGDLIFGESTPKKTDNLDETKQLKDCIIKTVLNQDVYGLSKGTLVYITKKDWTSGATGRSVMGWKNFEDFGKGNFAICYELKYLDYDPSNDQSYSIIIQNVKRGVSGYRPSFDPEDNGAIIKYEVENTVIIASFLTSEEAITRATKMAEALEIERVEPPHFVDNLYVWSSLPEYTNGKGVKIIVQPD
jgi:hypothetical protein